MVVYIQLLCIMRYVSFNIEMYGLCVGVLLRECRHSRCMGLLCCSFKCGMGDRFRFLSGVCVLSGGVCVCTNNYIELGDTPRTK